MERVRQASAPSCPPRHHSWLAQSPRRPLQYISRVRRREQRPRSVRRPLVPAEEWELRFLPTPMTTATATLEDAVAVAAAARRRPRGPDRLSGLAVRGHQSRRAHRRGAPPRLGKSAVDVGGMCSPPPAARQLGRPPPPFL